MDAKTNEALMAIKNLAEIAKEENVASVHRLSAEEQEFIETGKISLLRKFCDFDFNEDETSSEQNDENLM